MTVAARYLAAIEAAPMRVRCGRLLACNGLTLEARGPEVSVGELCEVRDESGATIEAKVVGFRDGRVILMPFGEVQQIAVGATVRVIGGRRDMPVGRALLGRVVDAFGNPIDERGPIEYETRVSLHRPAISPLRRAAIDQVLETGVKVIDTFLTMGRGQRVGIFAGSGVGKSTLLGMLAMHARVDVIVVGLVGERGREVGDFIAHALGKEGLARSVVMAATADQPPLVRVQAVYAAHAVAEYFRQLGLHVLLILDSMTRYAMAQREIGIAAGEPPTSRGYPPSVFTSLPRILERCGALKDGGSISAIYSVLVEGDDMNEPVADHMRAILDGHVVLSRELGDRGQLPAVDVLKSVSRLMDRLATREEGEIAREARALLAAHERSRDLISMGAYQPGHDATLDAAVRALPGLETLVRQSPGEHVSRMQAISDLARIVRPGEEKA